MPVNPKQPDEQDPKPEKSSLEETMRRHIADKNDHITDEDIRDVVVGQATDPAPGDPNQTIAEKAKELEKKIPKQKPGTPWDVLSDE